MGINRILGPRTAPLATSLPGTLPASLGLGLAIAMLPALAAAQAGGVQLTFGISQNLRTDDNQALDVKSAGTTTSATTTLTFGVLSDTATQHLSLNLAGDLRLSSGPATKGTDTTLGEPSLDLAYSLDGAHAGLKTTVFYHKADVSFLRPLTDFTDAQGHLILPSDLADLTGTGNRAEYGASLTYDWGRDGPLDFSLSAGLTGLDYSNTSSPALIDNRRATLTGTAGLQIDAATHASATLRFARFEMDDAGHTHSHSSGLDLAISRALQRGTVSATLSADHKAAGTGLSFHIDRAMDLPGGALSAGLGLTRTAEGQTNPTGSLTWQHALPRGQITAAVTRGVTQNAANADQTTTALALGYAQDLGPTANLALNLSYSLVDPGGANPTVTNQGLDVTYSHALTADWRLDLGYSHRDRDAGAGKARSNAVFLTLHHDFNLRH